MHKHPSITQKRIEQFIESYVKPRLLEKKQELSIEMLYMGVEKYDFRTQDEVMKAIASNEAKMTTVEPGYGWGPVWSTAWFRFQGTIPDEWAGEKIVVCLETGSETIIWENNSPVQGIDWAHQTYVLTDCAVGGEKIDIWAEVYGINPGVSDHGRGAIPPADIYKVGECVLEIYDNELFGLYYDLTNAIDLLKELPENEPRRGQLLWALNDVVNLCVKEMPPIAFEVKDIEGFRKAAKAAREILAVVYNKPAASSALNMSAIGMAHLDCAWLWPWWITVRKAAHTFSTAIKMMDQNPDYKFLVSQAVQLEWVKNDHPALYERIKEKVRSGQFELVGSMWVEADCNLTSGESLVRQFLYGKRFFMKEFGVETKDMFLPDVFGYAAGLPQILRKCRIDYFMTIKMSWNQFNKFPHNSFLWQGIDGSKVLSHFPPSDNCNGVMTPKELLFSVHNAKEHDRSDHALYLFGFGDGGGGPTQEMVENMRRVADIDGLPKVQPEQLSTFFGKLVEDYWDTDNPSGTAEKLQPYYLSLPEKKEMPVWAGELYFELHRGTYTSQAANKRNNRKAELALRDAEFLWSVAPGGLKDYPQEKLEHAWKIVLFNQFHDIIPGSSIREVYRDSDKEYAEVFHITSQLIEEAMERIASGADTNGMKRPALVVSNHPAGQQLVEIPVWGGTEVSAVQPVSGKSFAAQDDRGHVISEVGGLPDYGYMFVDLDGKAAVSKPTLKVDNRKLENKFVRVEFDEQGLISRILHKGANHDGSNREVLAPGKKANVFQFFDDQPLGWDAWDIEAYYHETGEDITNLESMEVVERGPVRAAIKLVRSFSNSRITQYVRLTSESPQIEFYTEIDWKEETKLLKVAFPVDINSPRATYEIQYGFAERPTHQNTSWDIARFEVCAHKWADLSEADYGVALLNDCKYGHDIFGGVMRLTLLRAPVAPDDLCDRGHHVLTYALLPHVGDLRQGKVIENAYALNAPAHAMEVKPSAGELPTCQSFFSVNKPGVIIEAVKKAEDEEALIIRLYDAHNSRGPCKLTTTLKASKAYLCDMLEDNLEELLVTDGAVDLYFNPFEIVTVKLYLK